MQVVIVGAACPSLLNQLVMRILIPSVLPGVGRIGQESRGPNDHHTVHSKQMQEAHAERSKKGMMQMTKEVLEAGIADNSRTPTLITVSNEEDSLMYVWMRLWQMCGRTERTCIHTNTHFPKGSGSVRRCSLSVHSGL